jgi:hypothetical protein
VTSKARVFVLITALFVPHVMAQEPAPYAPLVDADNRLALKLFHQMATDAPARSEDILIALTFHL